VNTAPDQQSGARQRRRKHSHEFKAGSVAACMQPGVSIAAIAMARGVNANLLRRWVQAAEMKPASGTSQSVAVRDVAPAERKPSFGPESQPPPAVPVPPADIRIGMPRGATTITVTWPASAAGECAAWMRELLR